MRERDREELEENRDRDEVEMRSPLERICLELYNRRKLRHEIGRSSPTAVEPLEVENGM